MHGAAVIPEQKHFQGHVRADQGSEIPSDPIGARPCLRDRAEPGGDRAPPAPLDLLRGKYSSVESLPGRGTPPEQKKSKSGDNPGSALPAPPSGPRALPSGSRHLPQPRERSPGRAEPRPAGQASPPGRPRPPPAPPPRSPRCHRAAGPGPPSPPHNPGPAAPRC